MTSPVVFDLAPHVVLPLTCSARKRVRVLRGCVWLTEEGNPHDIVLTAGEAHRITSRGTVLVEGMRTARVSIEAAASADVRTGPKAAVVLAGYVLAMTRPAWRWIARVARAPFNSGAAIER